MGTEGFKISQPPRTGHRDLQYVQRVVGGKELQHMVRATTTALESTEQTGNQRLTELCR